MEDFSQVLKGIPTEDGFTVENDFVELSQLGYLTSKVEWCGHTFLIKTLNLEEEIATGKIVSQFEGSIAQYKATLTSVVAASIEIMNDQPFMPRMGDMSVDAHINAKYKRVASWYWPTIEFLASEHAKLADRAKAQMEDLQKKFSVSMRTSSDLLESLTVKEPSTEGA